MARGLACRLGFHSPFICMMKTNFEPFPFLHRCLRCSYEWQDYKTTSHLWHRSWKPKMRKEWPL